MLIGRNITKCVLIGRVIPTSLQHELPISTNFVITLPIVKSPKRLDQEGGGVAAKGEYIQRVSFSFSYHEKIIGLNFHYHL